MDDHRHAARAVGLQTLRWACALLGACLLVLAWAITRARPYVTRAELSEREIRRRVHAFEARRLAL